MCLGRVARVLVLENSPWPNEEFIQPAFSWTETCSLQLNRQGDSSAQRQASRVARPSRFVGASAGSEGDGCEAGATLPPCNRLC
jgi:hypothetical protein